ncbi:MAG: alpha/beta hydrolase [Bacteroidales bacterium]|nr:alpha/beta hydrolase [Bacteroidales bacterium]
MKRISFTLLGVIIFLLLKTSVTNCQVNKKILAGSWLGNLETGAINLRLVFNLILNDEDFLIATLDSPDQGAKNIPLGKVSVRNDSLIIEAPLLKGLYHGIIVNDILINGIWEQNGMSFNVILKKLLSKFVLNRPQEPHPPYPYRVEEVTIPNKKFNIFLSGTLTIPEGNGPFPGVVLISGSGAQNRDEAIMGHKPFLVIADRLTRNGIAVLRYDDRGVGKSQGINAEATTADLATDADAAFQFMKTHKEINPSAIGLIGHSEGALIAAIVAASNNDVSFIISMAGPGVKGEEILFRQQSDISRLSGVKEEDIKTSAAINRKLFDIIKKEKDDLKAEEKVMNYYNKILSKQKISLQEREKLISQLQSSFNASTYPWLRYFLITDPSDYWKKVKCPVLALNGEKDTQVAADINLPAIEKAVKSGGNNNIKTVKLPGLNHLFQHCSTGLPSEYAQIEETISPEVLELICEWIKSHPFSLQALHTEE